MKKSIIIGMVLAVAGLVSADLSVNLSNGGQTFTTDGSTFVDVALVQLVYNPGAPTPAPGSVMVGSLLASGDTILTSFTTTSGYAGTWSNLGSGGDMGGLYSGDYSAGYLTLRVFDNSALTVGSKFIQFDLDVDGSLAVFNATAPATTYKTEGTLGGNIGASSYSIVPEPATLFLFVVGGMGAWFARRKNRSLLK